MRYQGYFDINLEPSRQHSGPWVIFSFEKHDAVRILEAINSKIEVWGRFVTPPGSWYPRYTNGYIEVISRKNILVVNIEAWGGSAWYVNASISIANDILGNYHTIIVGEGKYWNVEFLLDLLHDLAVMSLVGDNICQIRSLLRVISPYDSYCRPPKRWELAQALLASLAHP